MNLNLYIVNAFTADIFGGNPAAVVPLHSWLPEKTMQDMAAQHNLAETAFIVPRGEDFEIRWFTPTVEVELCGHATLAAARICFDHLVDGSSIIFHSRSGQLPVTRKEDGKITLDFPSDLPAESADSPLVERGLGARPMAVFRGTFDYMAVFEKQADIEHLNPDFPTIALLPARGLIATARGERVDFVTRCFFPQSGINEDPVTGSAYTVAAPYWAGVFGRNELTACQVSKRKGYIECNCRGARTFISGYTRPYMTGHIDL